MMNISLGQFFPAKSPIHRLDPRMKIVMGFLYIICAFLCRNVFSFLLLIASILLLMILSRIPVKIYLRGIRPVFFLLLFTMALNIFFTTGEVEWVSWKFIHIYREGVYNAFLMLIRIVALILGTSVFLTYTTTPIALTDALERLLSPLRVLHLPVHEFAMMMSIALRFIPTLVEETQKIIQAQKARGTDFESGGLIRRAKAMIPILIPLFVSSFRRADELATAMECRCYHGGDGRTRMRILHLRVSDFVALFLVILLGVALVLCNRFAPGYSL